MNFTSVLVLVLYAGIALIEIPPLKKEKNKGKLFLYAILFASAVVLSLLISIGVKLPSPSEPIKHIITSIFGE